MRVGLWLWIIWAPLSAELSWNGTEQGGITVSAQLSKESVAIDDTITLKVHARFPQDTDWDLAKMRRSLFPDANLLAERVRIIREDRGEIVNNKEFKEQEVSYEIDPITTGSQKIHLLAIPFIKGDKKVDYLGTLLTLDVRDIEVGEGDISQFIQGVQLPILGPVLSVSEAIQKKWLYGQEALKHEQQEIVKTLKSKEFPFLILGLWSLLGGLLIGLWKFKEKIVELVLIYWFPPIDPKERAIKEILELKNTPSPDQEVRVTRLSQIIRELIEEKYQVPMTRQTTEEFLVASVYNKNFNIDFRKDLAEFLLRADRVKFACFEMSSNEEQGAIDQAIKFVNTI